MSVKNTIFQFLKKAAIHLLIILSIALALTFCTVYRAPENRIDPYYPPHTSSFYINDFSHVLSEETETYIWEEATRLNQNTSYKLVTAMIPDVAGTNILRYRNVLSKEWGIGQTKDDEDILILFVTNEPDSSYDIGEGFKRKIQDGDIGFILKATDKDQKDRCWNRAARNSFTAIAALLYKYAGKQAPDSLKMLDQSVPCPDAANSGDGVEAISYTFADGDYRTPKASPDSAMFLFDSWDDFLFFMLFYTIFVVSVYIKLYTSRVRF